MKISIITVSYNSAKTIANTLRSVAAQTYLDIEHLVVDGQSTDETMRVVNTYSHPKLIHSSEPDNGIYDAMNKGVRLATGEIIGILNSDDFYVHPNVLKEVADIFATDPALDVVLGDVDFVKSANLAKPVRLYRSSGFKVWLFRFGFMPPHPAIFVKKTAYERVGFYNSNFKIAADFDFLVRLLLLDGAKYKTTKKLWVRMLAGGVSTSSWRSNLTITEEMHRSLTDNGIYTNILLLWVRLPVKMFFQIILMPTLNRLGLLGTSYF